MNRPAQVFEEIKEAYKGNDYPLVISASKSVKMISDGARFERNPFCQADYLVAFATDTQPTVTCFGDTIRQIKTIKIGNMDYWYIYEHIKSAEERMR